MQWFSICEEQIYQLIRQNNTINSLRAPLNVKGVKRRCVVITNDFYRRPLREQRFCSTNESHQNFFGPRQWRWVMGGGSIDILQVCSSQGAHVNDAIATATAQGPAVARRITRYFSFGVRQVISTSTLIKKKTGRGSSFSLILYEVNEGVNYEPLSRM